MDRPGKRGEEISWFRKVFGFPQPTPMVKPGTQPDELGQFPTSFDRNYPTLLQQLQAATRYRGIIEDAARRYRLQPAILCGIGSRESQWGLALRPPGPDGRGDFSQRRPRGDRYTPEPPDGPGYGRGLMQIDYDWHEFARIGNWQSPRENIMYACTVLEQARQFFQSSGINLTAEQLLRAVIAAYNGGANATLQAIQVGQDIDYNTTGQDYSRDVLDRSGWFQLHGWQ
jgi:soluble lytic murein transglycosylase-like protein